MEFKKNIKYLRMEYNLSQDELSKRLGVARSSVANYENGQNFPNKDILIKLSDIFNCSIDYLLGKSNIRNYSQLPSNSVNIETSIEQNYGDNSVELLENYKKLNEMGKEKAIENIKDLTEIPKYTEDDEGKNDYETQMYA